MLRVLQSLISRSIGKGKKEKKEREVITTRDIRIKFLVTHSSTNPAEQALKMLSAQDVILSLWYSDSTLNARFIFNF